MIADDVRVTCELIRAGTDGSATVGATLFQNGVAVADLSATGTWPTVCVDPLDGFVLC
jgi:hypothetical protein